MYECIVVDYRSQKQESNHTRLTVGGIRIDYPWEVATPPADLMMMKLLFNSTISTPGAKFFGIGVKKFYSIHPWIVLNTCSSHWISSLRKSVSNTTYTVSLTMHGSTLKSRRECMDYPKWDCWPINYSPNIWPQGASTHASSLLDYDDMPGAQFPLCSLLMTFESNIPACNMHSISLKHSNNSTTWP